MSIYAVGTKCAWAQPSAHFRSKSPTIQVRAKGDGVTDDSAAIEAAVHAGAHGGTVFFPRGVYRITRTIRIASDANYEGADGAIIRAPAGSFAFVTPYDQTSGITIRGLVFDGGGILLDGSSVPARKVVIQDCTFRNIVTRGGNWAAHNAVLIASGLEDSTISSNRFSKILEGEMTDASDREANGIHAWRLQRVTITGNIFDTVNQAISVVFDGPGPYADVVISGNVGEHIHRMGIELQGAHTSHLVVDGNQFLSFLNPFWNSFGLSIVVDGGSGTVIQNNLVRANPPSGPSQYGIGIEVGGEGTIVQNNRVEGPFKTGIAIGRAPKSLIKNNFVCGPAAGSSIQFETNPASVATVSANTTTTRCPGKL